ncbi:hypothetical protein [Halobellus sp. GM3]|uniref:hypothetical protein n=1 Tax=Halobellus sp. GM3 TaxID=3458410 RepID=UPI00403DDAF7
MRPALALLVALVVVIGTAPVAAATSNAAQASDAISAATAQVQDEGTETPTNDTARSATATAESDGDDGTADNTTSESNDTDESNATAGLEPGARLAGVIAVQRTEVRSEVDSRAFGQRVAAAATNESRASVVAAELNGSRERLAELRDRLAELERARDAGEISEGRYRAQSAQLRAEINALDRRLEQANESASSLPDAVRERAGINATNIERLRTDARNLSGPETAEIARGIAGGNAGRGLGDSDAPPRPNGAPGDSNEAGEAPGRSGNASAGGPSGDAETGAAPGEHGSGEDSGGSGEGARDNAQERNATRDGIDRGEGDGPNAADGAGDGSEAGTTDSDDTTADSPEGGDGDNDGSPGNSGHAPNGDPPARR